ncbi:fructosamine kinase family protein [Rhabdothermincola salaria]|uniref:fructosamine kinase family protein n=1 Tax=Rhabdothermincola salaria TaxID=2903142 RepID=UPI001E5EC890|nr:fructosamine kinase family protein [Rhabdothermincola salaria]MCD9624312.1 fructosamine kinase family protein [Rhabdothermincola salaria]
MERMLVLAVEAALSATVVASARLHGGDVAAAFRLDLGDGRRVFAKTHHDPPPGFFVTEAAGLSWLRDAGAVAVPEVLAVGDDPAHLVLEWIEEGSPGPGTDEAFGRSLAALHAAGAPCFGREDRRPTGSRSLPNDPAPSWATFYAERRLVPLAALAEEAGALPPAAVAGLHRVAARAEALLGPVEPPARLHGDLWAGNRLVDTGGRNWLIDPAAFGGHREFDLAMMRLFGGFGPRAHAAYEDVAPLADGAGERVELHQLAPLVVHAIKFGGGYVGAATSAIDRYA